MQITGTLINLYHVCKRELWLHANGVRFEHTSELVYEGKLLHETAYPQRSERYEEMEIDGCKIDYYDAKNRVVHEIKKSDKKEDAYEWQVKYYIYVLERNGIENVTGILEYPKLRETHEITLSESDREEITKIVSNIEQITTSENCPEMLKISQCRNCSYMDFCWSGEEENTK